MSKVTDKEGLEWLSAKIAALPKEKIDADTTWKDVLDAPYDFNFIQAHSVWGPTEVLRVLLTLSSLTFPTSHYDGDTHGEFESEPLDQLISNTQALIAQYVHLRLRLADLAERFTERHLLEGES